MEKTTKYNDLTNFFLDNWLFSIVILICVIIAFIPSFRDGVLHILKIFRKKRKDFIIQHKDETITFEYKIKSKLFDIVKINAVTHNIGVNAEYLWLKKYYPDYKQKCQSLSRVQIDENQSLHFDIIWIKNSKGESKQIYFDISGFFNDGGNTSSNLHEFAKNKIKELNNN